MADSPMETAQEYLEMAFPGYSLRETLEQETDYETVGDIDAWYYFTFRVEDDEGTTKRIQLTVEEHADDYVVSNSELSSEEPDEDHGEETGKEPTSPIEAATQYLGQAYPAYSLTETQNHDKDYETVGEIEAWHYFTFLLEDDEGNSREVEVTVDEMEDGSYQIGDSDIEGG